MRQVYSGVGRIEFALLLVIVIAVILGRLPSAVSTLLSVGQSVSPDESGQRFVSLMDDPGVRAGMTVGDQRWAVSDSIAVDNWEIFLTNRMTGERRRLTHDFASDRFPVVSPDGRRVAFVSWRDGNSEIYVVDVESGVLRNLSNHPAQDLLPIWSPDGSMLAFVSDRKGHEDIYLADVSRGLIHNLTKSPTDDTCPQWSADGRSMTFRSYHEGSWDDYRLLLDEHRLIHLNTFPPMELAYR